MASLLSSNALSSRIITLVAGKEKKELHVHSDLLSRSETLAACINGPFKETAESCVELLTWEVDTVISLVQWFYTGDYLSPLPTPVDQADTKAKETTPAAPVELSQQEQQDELIGNSVTTNPAPQCLSQNTDQYRFLCLNAGQDSHRQLSNHEVFIKFGWEITRSRHVGQKPDVQYTFGTSLVWHAKVYALADYLLLVDLKRTAYRSIDAGISIIKALGLDKTTIKDIATLAKYAYAHTNDHKSGDTDDEEPLRKRISLFIAEHFCLFHGPDALDVEREGGDLVQDINGKVRQLWEADKAALARIERKRKMEEDLAAIRNETPSKKGRKSFVK